MIEVKNIYVDQKIAPKEKRQERDVWILESESFKEPITIQIEYSDHDIEYLKAIKEGVVKQVGELQTTAIKLKTKEDEWKNLIRDYKESMKVKDQKIIELEKQLIESEQEKIKLQKGLENVKKMIESHDRLLEGVENLINEIKQKITKEPRVFSGQTFVSGNGVSALTALKVPDGNYIVNRATKIVEKNEYVTNDDVEVGAFNVHVQDGIFTPEYGLKGLTELDTPTATINRTFTMIPY